jgi:hypothetical protein
MEYCGFDMTNYDHEIEDGMLEALTENQGKVYGNHCGYNFCGYVYYHDGKFHEEVMRYGIHVGTMSADSLDELMTVVNNEYGWE